MEDPLEMVIALIVAGCICVVTWANAHDTVAKECEKLGSFYVGSKVYECKLKESK